jgi:magnesium chelatase accessory protein
MTSARIPNDWPYKSASEHVSAGGVNWHVQRTGSGPALLLIHGTAASTHSFRDLAAALENRFELIMVDLPGHGFSGAMQAPTLPRVAEGLGALLKRLDVQPAAAVGHSAGAAIALRMALDGYLTPQLLIGLAPALKPYGGAADGAASRLVKLAFLNPLAPRLFSMRATPERVTQLIARTGSHLDEAGAGYYAQLLKRHDHVAGALRMMANWNLRPLLDDLHRVAAPVTLLVGAGDRATPPRDLEAPVRRMAHCAVIELAGLGHLAHEENPGLCADHIRDAAHKAGIVSDEGAAEPRRAGAI